jgi:hypothetical protein
MMDFLLPQIKNCILLEVIYLITLLSVISSTLSKYCDAGAFPPIKQATLQYREFAGCREQKTLRSARQWALAWFIRMAVASARLYVGLRFVIGAFPICDLNFAPDGVLSSLNKNSLLKSPKSWVYYFVAARQERIWQPVKEARKIYAHLFTLIKCRGLRLESSVLL